MLGFGHCSELLTNNFDWLNMKQTISYTDETSVGVAQLLFQQLIFLVPNLAAISLLPYFTRLLGFNINPVSFYYYYYQNSWHHWFDLLVIFGLNIFVHEMFAKRQLNFLESMIFLVLMSLGFTFVFHALFRLHYPVFY